MATVAAGEFRERLGSWLESAGPRNFITGLIVLNAGILGLETSTAIQARFGDLLQTLNTFILTVFVLEITAKLYAFDKRFFRSGWNVFDFLIVVVSLVPASGPLSIMRALRILRVLRLLSTVRPLRMVVDSLLHAIPGIGWTAGLLMMMFYIFGVMGTELFGATFPQWFGSLGATMYTLFQVMTLESWSMGIARPVMETYPWAWLFFVPFILISSFTVLNLFIAIIVSATQAVHFAEGDQQRDEIARRAHDERRALTEAIEALHVQLQRLEERLPPRRKED